MTGFCKQYTVDVVAVAKQQNTLVGHDNLTKFSLFYAPFTFQPYVLECIPKYSKEVGFRRRFRVL